MRVFLILMVAMLPRPLLSAQTPSRPVLQELRWHPVQHGEIQDRGSPDPKPPKDGLTLGFAGLIGAVGGAVVGGLIGSRIASCNEFDDQFCGLEGAVGGAAIASTFTIPLAVHLANDSRGNYGLSLAASALLAGAGWALAYSVNEAAPILLVPLGQIVSSALIERRTTR